jgi:chromosome partitioning protein
MKIIVVASRKGGVGKTTLAGHLAVMASNGGKTVVMFDEDPQHSLTEWFNSRKAEQPLLADLDNLEGIRASGEADLAIIDTPPSHDTGKLLRQADLVVIPVRASAHDLRAVSATVDLVRDARKPMVFVINAVTPRSRLAGEAAIELSQHGTVAPVQLGARQDYVVSMADGRTVLESDPQGRSADEIRRLWDYLARRLAG